MRLVEIRRVSTEDQAKDDRAGLSRQEHSNKETANRLGAELLKPPFELTDVCRENFISTPEWRSIARLIQAPDIHIVVDDPDRFMADFGGIEILAECQRTATVIHHPGGVLNPSTLDGQLVGVIRSVLAGNELKSIRKRVQGAKEAKRREGAFPSASVSLPTGIAYVRVKDKRVGRWTYTDDISRVREVWRLVTDESVHNWAEVGRRTGFSAQTARNILKNPIYKGWWIVDRRREQGPTPIKPDGRRKDRRKVSRPPDEVIKVQVFRPKGSLPDEKGREEALVDEAIWDSVRELIEQKRGGYHRQRDASSGGRFTYTGRLWCAGCSEPLWGRTRPAHGREKARRDWYACKTTQVAGNKCATKYMARDRVNAGLDHLFATLLSDPSFATSLVEEGLAAEREDYSDQIAGTKVALKKLDAQRKRLLDLYLAGGWSRDELDGRRRELESQYESHERDLRRLEQLQRASDRGKVLEGFREILVTLREYEFWSPRQKREFLARFFPKIEVSKRGVERMHVQLPSNLFDGRDGREADGLLTLKMGMTWERLRPPAELTDFGLPVKDLYTRADIMKMLALTEHQFNDRLKKGRILEAAKVRWGKRAWTIVQMREIAAAWKARELRNIARLGNSRPTPARPRS